MQPVIRRKIIKISPKDIKIPPNYIRKTLRTYKLNRSIREKGQIDLIQITEDKWLFDGLRRLDKKLKKRNVRKIQVEILTGINKNNMLDYQLEKFLTRKDLDDIEKAIAFRDFKNKHNLSITETAKRLRMTTQRLYTYLNLLKLPKETQMKVAEGKMKKYKALEMFDLSPARSKSKYEIKKGRRAFKNLSPNIQFNRVVVKLSSLEYQLRQMKFGNPRILIIKKQLESLLDLIDKRLKC